MDYKQKYLKYKKKYIDYKNMNGGKNIIFSAKEDKYIIDNKKNGLFQGDIFIDNEKITDKLYKGIWNCNKKKYHYFGNFINSIKNKTYKIDCVGEFIKKNSKIIFNGIYSDKLITTDFLKYKNIPLNEYNPNEGDYHPIDVLINDNLKFFNEKNKKSYLKEILFYQEGWYCLLPNKEQFTLLENIIHGYNSISKLNIDTKITISSMYSHKQLPDRYNYSTTKKQYIKNIYDSYNKNNSNDDLFTLCSLLLNVNILCITEIHNKGNYENIELVLDDLSTYRDTDYSQYDYFYYDYKIYTVDENEKYFNNKTIIFYKKKDIYYNLFNNDDVIKYNLIMDLNYKKRIKNTEIIYNNFGIGNCGNTCYLNSCLQFFIHCPPFLKYLNERKNKKKLNDFYKINDVDIIFNNGIDLKNYYNNSSNIYKIQDFLELDKYQQGDTGECILKIYDIIEEKNITFDINDMIIKYDNIKYPHYNIILKNINNPINNIFSSYICSTIFCENTKVSESYEPLSILNLNLTKIKDIIKDKNDIDIEIEKYIFDLSNFFKLEKIEKSEKYKTCEILKKNAFKQFKLYYLSKIFIISLKRWHGISRKKISDKIDIPLEIDFKDYMHEKYSYDDDTKYKLIGYIIQSGSVSGGHYWSYSYIENKKKWNVYNDSREYEVNGTPELENAYVLMYQKIK